MRLAAADNIESNSNIVKALEESKWKYSISYHISTFFKYKISLSSKNYTTLSANEVLNLSVIHWSTKFSVQVNWW